uniref:Uncharacterized protein n=1 Tax=Tetraodon nigroviridis TaxID=99883 RepID=H3D256_TETNG
MSSAPSAPALSAVLRCRGNIWRRNSPSKPPLSAAHSPATAASAWEAASRRERVVTGTTTPAVFESLRGAFRGPRNNRVSVPERRPAEARRAASAAPNARGLARTLRYGWFCTFPRLDPLSALVFRLSARCSRGTQPVAETVPFWVLRSACVTLSRLVSELVSRSFLALLRRSSLGNVTPPRPLAAKLRDASLKDRPPGIISNSEDKQDSGLKVTDEGAD